MTPPFDSRRTPVLLSPHRHPTGGAERRYPRRQPPSRGVQRRVLPPRETLRCLYPKSPLACHGHAVAKGRRPHLTCPRARRDLGVGANDPEASREKPLRRRRPPKGVATLSCRKTSTWHTSLARSQFRLARHKRAGRRTSSAHAMWRKAEQADPSGVTPVPDKRRPPPERSSGRSRTSPACRVLTRQPKRPAKARHRTSSRKRNRQRSVPHRNQAN